jgi:hypothetical protein
MLDHGVCLKEGGRRKQQTAHLDRKPARALTGMGMRRVLAASRALAARRQDGDGLCIDLLKVGAPTGT